MNLQTYIIKTQDGELVEIPVETNNLHWSNSDTQRAREYAERCGMRVSEVVGRSFKPNNCFY